MSNTTDEGPAGKGGPLDEQPADDPGDAEDASRVASARDSKVGTIGFDDLGQPRWTWITELGETADEDEDTFDLLKALDNDELSVADEPGTRPDRRRASKESGYDPYDTSRMKIKGKLPRP